MSLKSLFQGIRGKLFLSAMVPVLGFIILGFVSYRGLTTVSQMLEHSYSQEIPNVTALGNLEGGRARIGQYLGGALINHAHPEVRERYMGKAAKALAEFKAAAQTYEDLSFLPGEGEKYEPVKAKNQEFETVVEGFIAGLKDPSPENYEKIRAEMVEGPYMTHSVNVRQFVAEALEMYAKATSENNIKQKAESEKALNLIYLIGALCGLTSMISMMIIGTKVSRTIHHVADQLTVAGKEVNSAIVQLSSAGQGLSESSSTAAAALEETVASLEELTSMVNLNSENAQQAATLSRSSTESAREGEGEIRNLISSMQQISASSKQIEEIISVIDDIAFQTNLLALNAAVEAARAGEQGKGFAVVADAVRTLAQKSSIAAKDISGLIRESVTQIEVGTKIADRSEEVLSKIVTSIKKVSDLNTEISTASSEQSSGISQISQAMNQLDNNSQTNAASSEEIAATSEQISAQTQQMQSLIRDLNQVVTGKAA